MHTKLVSLFIALFLCLPLFAQKESVPRIDSEGVYLIPDEMPKFPGGMQAMMKYLVIIHLKIYKKQVNKGKIYTFPHIVYCFPGLQLVESILSE